MQSKRELRAALSSRILCTTKGIFQDEAAPRKLRDGLLANPGLREMWQIDVLLNPLPCEEALAIYTAHKFGAVFYSLDIY